MSDEKILMGYDNYGTVYDNGSIITRKVTDAYLPNAIEIFDQYKRLNLSNIGIVETAFDQKNKLFTHDKYTITYPYEWTANMFKDAVLFHLRLFIELNQYGLILKDAVPNNILYHFGKFKFVDFLSIVKKNRLIEENWLFDNKKFNNDPAYLIIEKMFVHYMLIPFCAMVQKNFVVARKLLFAQACNTGANPPQWKQLSIRQAASPYLALKNLIRMYFTPGIIPQNVVYRMQKLLKRTKTVPFHTFCKDLSNCIESADVSPADRGYTDYYKSKKEDFDFKDQSEWKPKQVAVYQILTNNKPETVLDLGANTGWFSLLAEKMGAKVIATDADENAIDALYLHAKANKLNIIPLKLSFEELYRKIFGYTPPGPEYENRNFDQNPLFLPAVQRLRSELVLCLALLHHLILGQGLSVQYVFDALASLTERTLVLEFIGLDDQLIINEPAFFDHLSNHNPDTYNLEVIITEGKKHFTKAEVLNSHPETRKIIVFEK